MAHDHQHSHIEDPGSVSLPGALRLGLIVGAALGAVAWVGTLVAADTEEARRNVWMGYLMAYMYFMMLGLGGVVFTAVQYCASARWSIAVRRIAEGMGAFIPFSFGLFLVLGILGYGTLYAPRIAQFEFAPLKAAYLSQAGVLIKGILFYAAWFFLASRIRGNSLAQDRSRDPKIHDTNVKWSIAFLIVFAYTFSLHAFDVVKALEPKWFSTMFGVYVFCGLFLSTHCVLALVVIAMRRRRSISEAIGKRHLYDLGTWIMAFSCFMCYIGFSQYMLIWYANLPEETFYLMIRTTNGWELVAGLLPLLKWVIPFLVLMPQGFRGNPPVMVFVCVAVLAGQALDLYWMIYPEFNGSPVWPGLPAIGAFLAIGCLWGVVVDSVYRKHSVLPVGDPHLVSSVTGSYV